MIERKIVEQRIKEFQIHELISSNLKRVGLSDTKVQRTPLGEKIIVSASRPGLVVGRGGANIKKLTKLLKKEFGLENPQIEISEVENIYLDPQIVAESMANSLERFGAKKFKGIGHRTMSEVMKSGALGVEILMSGKIPSSRARRWRFYQGYLKKCGNVAQEDVRVAYSRAELKTGTVGIQVRIMPGNIRLPDDIRFKEIEEQVEEVTEEKQLEKAKETKEEVKKDIKETIKKEEKPAEPKKEEAKVEEKKENVPVKEEPKEDTKVKEEVKSEENKE